MSAQTADSETQRQYSKEIVFQTQRQFHRKFMGLRGADTVIRIQDTAAAMTSTALPRVAHC